jgi:DNA-binding response OmpR family regulator
MRVLLAEDKLRMAEVLQRALQREGHTVTLAFDGEEALSIATYEQLDAIILDVMLPKLDGFTVIRRLRAISCATPTIMLTARDAMTDIVQGLDAGADDYLTKPFSLEVLLARLRALGRRNSTAFEPSLQFADLTLDLGSRHVSRGGRSLPLTRTEFALLEVLMRRAGRIVPRDVLIEAGWGLAAQVNESTLYVFIRNLREKIDHPGERPLLHTARGVGYVIRDEPA